MARLTFTVIAAATSMVTLHAAEPKRSATEADALAVEQFLDGALRETYPRVLKSVGSTLTVGSLEYNAALKRSLEAIMLVRPDDCYLDQMQANTCGMRPVNIPTTSMAPSFEVGDIVMTLPTNDGHALRRGDVVVFWAKSSHSAERTLRTLRIVGMPGETLRLRDGLVEVDGRPMAREVTNETLTSVFHEIVPISWEVTAEHRRYRVAGNFGHASTSSTDSMEPVKVPTGSYYVLGDNRENSVDSRFPEQLGTRFVAATNLVGRVMIVYASKDATRVGLRTD